MSSIPFTDSAVGAQIVDPDNLSLDDVDLSQANSIAQDALKSVEEPSEHEDHPIAELPPDGSVTLLVGAPFKGEVVFTAVVRELTGADEEYLAQPANTKTGLRYMKAILERALVKIGDHKPTLHNIQDLTLADAEILVRAVRHITFGDTLRLNDVPCPTCGTEMDISYNVMTDVEIKDPVGEKGQQSFSFTASSGEKISYRLPTIGDQTKVVDADVKTLAEANTLLLTEIVDNIDGMPITRARDLRDMSMRLRREILREVDEKNPGIRYQDVEHECATCGNKFPLVLSTADLFRY